MNELNKGKPKNYLKDKVLLILSAIGVGLCLSIFWIALDKLKIKEEWQFYIFISILYIFVFTYGIHKVYGLKKKIKNLVSLLLLVFFTVFPILVGFMVFHFKILPFPKRNFTYLIGGLFLLPIAAVCFDESLKFFERRKKNKKKINKMIF